MLKNYEINYSKRALIIFTAMTSILRGATFIGSRRRRYEG